MWHAPRMRPSAIVAALAAIACSSEPTDVVIDAGTTVDAGAPSPFVFRIRFVSDDGPEKIYLQTGTMEGPQSWVRLLDTSGARIPLSGNCAFCSCDQCNGGCGVCGAALPTVAAVEAGQQRDESFGGFVYPVSQCSSTSFACYTRTPLAAGNYVARFCWGSGEDSSGFGAQITGETCADVSFAVPVAGGVVEHLVDHGG